MTWLLSGGNITNPAFSLVDRDYCHVPSAEHVGWNMSDMVLLEENLMAFSEITIYSCALLMSSVRIWSSITLFYVLWTVLWSRYSCQVFCWKWIWLEYTVYDHLLTWEVKKYIATAPLSVILGTNFFVFTIGVGSGCRIGYLECMRTTGSALRGVDTRRIEEWIENDRLNWTRIGQASAPVGRDLSMV